MARVVKESDLRARQGLAEIGHGPDQLVARHIVAFDDGEAQAPESLGDRLRIVVGIVKRSHALLVMGVADHERRARLVFDPSPSGG